MRDRRIIIVLLTAILLGSGCDGGGAGAGATTEEDIAAVRSCLTEAKLKVEAFSEEDKKVTEGVFATTDLSKGDRKEFTFAIAALVESEKTVEEFERDTKEFSETLSMGEQKLVVDSGTEGRYVWVVGGASKDATYEAAHDCVQR